MALEATEFIRRFLLHVLPSRFMHIRHYGFLANRFRKDKLALCRELLGVSTSQEPDKDLHERQPERESVPLKGDRGPQCSKCNTGRMRIVHAIAADTLRGPTQEEIALWSRAPPTAVLSVDQAEEIFGLCGSNESDLWKAADYGVKSFDKGMLFSP